MKNVVILGDSDLASTKSLQKGLELKNNLKVFNLSIGATTSSHKIIELKLKRNKEIIDKADLIIYHSNANDSRYFISPKIAYREINWAFKELYFCSKKVLICILPSYYSQYTAIIENIQRQLASLYGFSVIDWSIDMNESYIIKFLLRDNLHFFDFVLRNIGVSISENIDKFLPSKYLNINNDNPQFVTCLMNEVKLDRNCETREIEWLGQICYNVYILKKDNKLKFPKKYYGYNLIAIETHNLNWAAMSSLVIKDDDRNTVFLARPILNVKSLNNPIKINKNLTMQYNYTNNLENVDKVYPWSMPEGQKSLGYIGLIGFLLASPEGNYYTEEIDFEALANENIKIPEEYDFNHLIPPIELYKEIIDEYCSIMDPRKLASLQNRIKEKDDIISTLNSVKSRIQNQLSYKLGQTLILNSKSVLGYLSLPFIILSIVISHKQEQKAYKFKVKKNPNLALPPLETYPDYNEALKEKECFTYKLGEAFIKASKNWYKGGYIKFILKDVPRLKREFGKKG